MIHHTYNLVKLAIKIALFLCVIAAIAFGITMYRLKQSPLEVDTNSDFVQSFLKVGDGQVKIKQLSFFFDKSLKARAGWASWVDANGETQLSVNEMTFTVSNRNLLRGKIVPKTIEVNGLRLDIEVLPEYIVIAGQEISLKKPEKDIDNVENKVTLLSFLNNEGSDNRYFSALKSVRINGAHVNFKDRVRFKQWRMDNGLITFDKSFLKGESLHFRGDIFVKDEEKATPAHIYVTHQRNQNNLNVRLKIDDVDASYADGYMPFTNPFTGRGRIEVDTQVMDDNSLNHTSIKLALGKGSTHISAAYAFPFIYEKADLDVKFTVQDGKHRMELANFNVVDSTGFDMTVSGNVENLMDLPEFDLKLTTKGHTTVEHVASYLPNKFIGGVVDWLNEHFKASEISNLKLNYTGKLLELPHCLDKCGFDGSFDFSNTTLKFLENAPALKNASGKFVMKDGKIIIEPAGSNKIGEQTTDNVIVTIQDHFDIDKDANITIQGEAHGPVDDLVNILESELGDADKPWNIDISGKHKSDVFVNFPLEDITYAKLDMDIKSIVSDLKVPTLIPEIPVESDQLSLSVTGKELHAKGRAKLAGYDASIQWREKMRNFAGETSVEVAGHFPVKELSKFIEVGDVTAKGDIPGLVKVQKIKKKERYSFNIKGDLENTDLAFEPLNWNKPAQVPLLISGDGYMDITNDTLRFNSLKLSSADVDIEGKIEVKDGDAIVEFPKLNLAKHRLSVSYADGVTSVGGTVLDMTKLDVMDGAKNKKNEKPGTVEVKVKQLLLQDAELLDVTGKFVVGEDGSESQFLKGKFPNEAAFLASYDTDKHGAAALLLKSDDAGSALRALGLPSHFYKGSIDAKIDFKSDAQIKTEMKHARKKAIDGAKNKAIAQKAAVKAMGHVSKAEGSVSIYKTNLKDAPAVVSILSILSLEQLLKNENGVYFDSIYLPLKFRGDHILFDSLVMKGPSIGVEIDGNLNSETKHVLAHGQLVPIRGVNNLISKIPLIGDILTGSQDGVLVADFEVKGTIDDPKISTNPFSVVTPGIVKDIFRVITP